MASFHEVMRQIGRICVYNFGDCDTCDFRLFCPSKTFLDKYVKAGRAERLEKMVLSWADEHPEPVYPTWAEWLAKNDILEVTCRAMSTTTASSSTQYIETVRTLPQFYRPIPADIAEKLGIEPKEDA